MIQFGGMILVMAGVTVAPYVKKALYKFQQDTSKSGKNLSATSDKQMIEDPELHTELAVTASEERHKLRFILTTGTMGLAVMAQTGFFWLTPISYLLIGYFSADVFKEAATALFKEKKIKVDILDTVVILLTLMFGQIGAAAFMVWILDLADMLLQKTTKKSQKYLTDIFGEQPRYAWLLVDGAEVRTEVKDLKKGDHIVVGTGESIPVDGVIIDGGAMIDQQSLTGESTPADKQEDDHVYASTVIVAGKVTVRVEETGKNTLASQVISIINEASNYDVRLQSVGEKMADKMVIPTLGLGVMGYASAGTGALLAIINADYGTGIRVAAPIALLASLGNAAKNGILIKHSEVVEKLKEIDVVLFDKTGTLTNEIPAVSRIITADDTYNEDEVLFYTATAEQKFAHPIAAAILQKARDQNISLGKYDDSEYDVGLGINVKIGDNWIKVGSSRYMEREGIAPPEAIKAALEESAERGQSAILTAINDQVAGMIELQSTIRDEAIDVIADLRANGIKEIVLISGDHEAPTKELAHQLDIDRYFAGVLPNEKADYVKLLQDEGKKVMMVGDGINDSAALSHADIGVSLKGASTIAVDVADVIFMDGTLTKFHYLFEVAENLQKNVKRSFLLVAVPNTVCIVGAFMGVFGLKASLVLNNGFNLIAAANGMLPYTETSEKEDHKPVVSKENNIVNDKATKKKKRKKKKEDSVQKVA
jgi:Cu2+-exporting ATPase